MSNVLPKILLVEDQPFSASLFKMSFSEYTVFTALTGAQSLEIYRRERPDITFLDIGLPDISGLDVLKTITSEFEDAYVIMISDLNNMQYVKRSHELRAKGFLAKPYNKEYIMHYIDLFMMHKSKGK